MTSVLQLIKIFPEKYELSRDHLNHRRPILFNTPSTLHFQLKCTF